MLLDTVVFIILLALYDAIFLIVKNGSAMVADTPQVLTSSTILFVQSIKKLVYIKTHLSARQF